VKHFLKFVIILFLPLTGCASNPFEKNRIQDSTGADPQSIVLNYENRVQKYKTSNIESHLKIYIEIEKPYIISAPSLKEINRIYSIAEIEGTTVFRIAISSTGKILSSEKILSAGFSLDDAALDILKEIKFEPSYLAGNPHESFADIKISFRADGAE
jgi:hypothetical protein